MVWLRNPPGRSPVSSRWPLPTLLGEPTITFSPSQPCLKIGNGYGHVEIEWQLYQRPANRCHHLRSNMEAIFNKYKAIIAHSLLWLS